MERYDHIISYIWFCLFDSFVLSAAMWFVVIDLPCVMSSAVAEPPKRSLRLADTAQPTTLCRITKNQGPCFDPIAPDVLCSFTSSEERL